MLKSTIKSLVQTRGFEYVSEPQFINVLADYQVFVDCPAIKFVLKTVIEEGYAGRLFNHVTNGLPVKDVAERYVDELFTRYGFRKDVSVIVLNSLLFALDQPELHYNPIVNTEALPSTSPSDDEHIVFSGISLSHSIKEIEKHMQNRGFKTSKRQPYLITMKGTFCDINDVEMFINGSPLGVTRCVSLSFPDYTSLYAGWSQNLYNLLHQKYGDADYAYDPLDTVRNGNDGFNINRMEYYEMIDNYKNVFTYKWDINGGQIEFRWSWDYLSLTYSDTLNTERAKIHQEQFNAESI